MECAMGNHYRTLDLKTEPEERWVGGLFSNLFCWHREHKGEFLPWLFTKSSLCWLMKSGRPGKVSLAWTFFKWILNSVKKKKNSQLILGCLRVIWMELLRLPHQETDTLTPCPCIWFYSSAMDRFPCEAFCQGQQRMSQEMKEILTVLKVAITLVTWAQGYIHNTEPSTWFTHIILLW